MRIKIIDNRKPCVGCGNKISVHREMCTSCEAFIEDAHAALDKLDAIEADKGFDCMVDYTMLEGGN